MQLALVIGSVRKERQSYKVAHYLEKVLQQRSITTDLIDLLNIHYPFTGYRLNVLKNWKILKE